MPRAKAQVEDRTGRYRPHTWRDPQAIAATLGAAAQWQAATLDAAHIVGRAGAAQLKYASLNKRQGRPPRVVLKDAIRHLRRVFAEHDAGKSWGRIARENEFIRLCLTDAGLIDKYSTLDHSGALYKLLQRTKGNALPFAIWKRGPGRQKAVESIANRLDVRADTDEWELPTVPSAYVIRIEDGGDGVCVIWNTSVE